MLCSSFYCRKILNQNPFYEILHFFFFFITLEHKVEWCQNLWAFSTGPPRKRFTFLWRSCSSIENYESLYRVWWSGRAIEDVGWINEIHIKVERESSVLTTYWPESTWSSRLFSGPASRHGSLNSLFQVALYLPCNDEGEGREILVVDFGPLWASTAKGLRLLFSYLTQCIC